MGWQLSKLSFLGKINKLIKVLACLLLLPALIPTSVDGTTTPAKYHWILQSTGNSTFYDTALAACKTETYLGSPRP